MNCAALSPPDARSVACLADEINKMSEGSPAMRRSQIGIPGTAAFLTILLLSSHAVAGSTSPAEIIREVQLLIQQGDLARARSRLAQALVEFPRAAGLYDLLGVVDAQQGSYGEAETNFKKAIQEDPRLTGAYLNLGHLYQENSGKDREALNKALETYQRLLRIDATNVEANYQTAVLLEHQGAFKTSLLHLARLPAPDQERAQALAFRLADHVGLGERFRAEELASRLLTKPDLSEADVVSILPVIEAHHADGLGERLLEGLVERQLASPKSLFQLGLVYKRRGRLDLARQTLERVAAEEPRTTAVLMELARVANQQRDYKGALGYLAHARDLEPENAAIHYLFGVVCVEEKLLQEAYTSFKKAVTLDPNNPYYNYAFGSVAVNREDAREAVPYFRRYCELKPGDRRGNYALGAAYFYSHDFDSARKELQAVARFPETRAGAHYYLGRMANQEGKLDEAILELRQALEADPRYAAAYAELGVVHLKKKEYAESEQALREALDSDPDNYIANLNLMVLYQRTQDPRAEAQARKFEEVKQKRAEMAKELLRTIEVRP